MGMKVADLLDKTTLEWDRIKVHNTLPELAKQVFCVKPSKAGVKNRVCRIPNSSREYTTKSGYYTAEAQLTQLDESQVNLEWTADIWKGDCSPKLKVFIWRCALEAIAIGENLMKRGINISTSCIHLGVVEIMVHLLFHCPYARRVWSLILFKTPFEPLQISDLKTRLKVGNSFDALPPTGVAAGPLFPWNTFRARYSYKSSSGGSRMGKNESMNHPNAEMEYSRKRR
ncbi:unnamed protein product [Arabis nemorensis]|uniref:Reverse transcriptase zinc-binding domain-containing protein n=1 Tax=Arabis nemorensis TaxID=586526 RepID=A0A565BPF6_9BRAS|nr:unnamed protein product [Arabis nemorensis]